MENEIQTKSVWNKTQEEMTTGDNIKVVAIVTVVSTVAWVGVYGAVLGGISLWEKRQAKKAQEEIDKKITKK